MNTDFVKESDKNKLLKWALWALILLTVFLGVQTLAAFKGLRTTDPVTNSISVTGEGEVVTVPDVATFSFSVSADAANVSDAQSRVTEKMNAVLAALEALGVEEKDIKTSGYSVWPKYRYESAVSYPCTPNSCPPSPGGRQVLEGYTANHFVTVKVRNTEDAGRALAVAGDNGATDISGISFTMDDPDQALEEARALAIADAKTKAKVLSKDLGVRLVRVVSYFDSTQNPPMPYGMGHDGDMAVMMKSAESSPTIPQGENKVRVNVTVTYEIR